MDNRIDQSYRVASVFSAHPFRDSDTEETRVEVGEIVTVFYIETGPLPDDTTVTFKRANGSLWTARFDSGDPFITPFSARLKPFPMPNDRHDGRIVIASAYYTEASYSDATRAAVLLLNPAEPFYSVHVVNLDTGETEMRSRHENIVPATIEYADLGLRVALGES